VLKRVDDHLREKRRNPAFRDLQELDEEKLKVAKVIIGERIRRGLAQAALAKQLGVTQQQVSNLENGDFDNLATLQKALTALGYQVKSPPSGCIGRTGRISPEVKQRSDHHAASFGIRQVVAQFPLRRTRALACWRTSCEIRPTRAATLSLDKMIKFTTMTR